MSDLETGVGDSEGDVTAWADVGELPRDDMVHVVGHFYAKVLDVVALAPYFDDVDMNLQNRRLTDALLIALGQPQSRYSSMDDLRQKLRNAHYPLNIKSSEYDVMYRHLIGALRTNGWPEKTVATFIEICKELRDDIVAPSEGAESAPDEEELIRQFWGYRIRERRTAMGWRQRHLATQLGAAQSSVSEWESGKVELGLATMRRLAQVFNTTIAELFGINYQQGDVGQLIPSRLAAAIARGQPVDTLAEQRAALRDLADS